MEVLVARLKKKRFKTFLNQVFKHLNVLKHVQKDWLCTLALYAWHATKSLVNCVHCNDGKATIINAYAIKLRTDQQIHNSTSLWANEN